MTDKKKTVNVVAESGGSTVDSMLVRLRALQEMSPEERKRFIHKATSSAKKVKLTDSERAMMMAADGYFQEQGE